VTTEANCAEDIWIEGEVCDPNPCPNPPPEGACCFGEEECVIATEEDCVDMPGYYLWIEGEVCDPNPCPPVSTKNASWGSIKAGYR
jgi:hypothetical protein